MSLQSVLTNLGNAIRSKTGGTSAMTLVEMTDAVNSLDASGIDTSDATATAEDMAQGVTAYVNGTKVTGTIPLWTSMLWASPTASWDSTNTRLQLTGTFGARRFLEKNGYAYMYCAGSRFGDATTADVAYGKTFTSASGLLVTGEALVSTGNGVYLKDQTTGTIYRVYVSNGKLLMEGDTSGASIVSEVLTLTDQTTGEEYTVSVNDGDMTMEESEG